jgi:hypothetical protein
LETRLIIEGPVRQEPPPLLKEADTPHTVKPAIIRSSKVIAKNKNNNFVDSILYTGVHNTAEKQTQPLSPGSAWLQGLWEITV